MVVETSEQEEGPEVYSSKTRAWAEVTSAAAEARFDFGGGKMITPISSPVAR